MRPAVRPPGLCAARLYTPAMTDDSRRSRLADRFWARHSNPKSGWSRVPTGALLVLAVYRRDARLLAATLAWTVLNPVLFPEPAEDDAWMSRGVLGERAWLEDGHDPVTLSYPGVLNALNVPVFLYALYAAARRRPLDAAAAVAVSSGLKLRYVAEMARYYDRTRD